MDARAQHSDQRHYGATWGTWTGAGLIAAVLLVLVVAGVRVGSYGIAGLALVLGAALVASLWRLQLTLSATTLEYRTLLGTRRLPLQQVSGAWLSAPRGVWSYGRAMPMLGLSLHQAPSLVLGLQALPDVALVDLGRRLAPYGVRIEVAASPAAQRLARRIWQVKRR